MEWPMIVITQGCGVICNETQKYYCRIAGVTWSLSCAWVAPTPSFLMVSELVISFFFLSFKLMN